MAGALGLLVIPCSEGGGPPPQVRAEVKRSATELAARGRYAEALRILERLGDAAEALGPAVSGAGWVGCRRSPILLSGGGIAAWAAVAVQRWILGLPTKNPEAAQGSTPCSGR